MNPRRVAHTISPSKFSFVSNITIKSLPYSFQSLVLSKASLGKHFHSLAFISNEMQIMNLYHYNAFSFRKQC